MRFLALDWGTVRMGGAISDPEGNIAFPLEKFIESKTAIEEIQKIVQGMNVDRIVLGVPKSLSGNHSASSEKVQQFASVLKKEFNLPIDFVDERLSSIGASKFLTGLGITYKQQRGQVDNIAAAQMLQTYLDTKNK